MRNIVSMRLPKWTPTTGVSSQAHLPTTIVWGMEANHGAAGAPVVVVVKERDVSVEKVILEDLTVNRDLERERARVTA